MTLSEPTTSAPSSGDKPYDAVATQRRIREQISRETEGMSFEELQHYLRARIAVPFDRTRSQRTGAMQSMPEQCRQPL